jgi:hypothetical protein
VSPGQPGTTGRASKGRAGRRARRTSPPCGACMGESFVPRRSKRNRGGEPNPTSGGAAGADETAGPVAIPDQDAALVEEAAYFVHSRPVLKRRRAARVVSGAAPLRDEQVPRTGPCRAAGGRATLASDADTVEAAAVAGTGRVGIRPSIGAGAGMAGRSNIAPGDLAPFVAEQAVELPSQGHGSRGRVAPPEGARGVGGDGEQDIAAIEPCPIPTAPGASRAPRPFALPVTRDGTRRCEPPAEPVECAEQRLASPAPLTLAANAVPAALEPPRAPEEPAARTPDAKESPPEPRAEMLEAAQALGGVGATDAVQAAVAPAAADVAVASSPGAAVAADDASPSHCRASVGPAAPCDSHVPAGQAEEVEEAVRTPGEQSDGGCPPRPVDLFVWPQAAGPADRTDITERPDGAALAGGAEGLLGAVGGNAAAAGEAADVVPLADASATASVDAVDPGAGPGDEPGLPVVLRLRIKSDQARERPRCGDEGRSAPPIPRASRPKRIRKVKRLLDAESDDSSAVPADGRPNTSGARKRAALLVKSEARPLGGLPLSAPLRDELMRMDENRRVAMVHRDGWKVLSGQSAPMRKNLEAYLLKNPDYAVLDKQGVHKNRPQNARERGVERSKPLSQPAVPSIEAGGREEHGSEGASGVLEGLDISDELRVELGSARGDERVRMWNREEKRVLAGKSAPRLRNLRRFLTKNPGYDVFDVHGRHRDRLIRERGDRRDRDRERDRERNRGRIRESENGGEPAHDPLAKARLVANETADLLGKDVYNVMGSLRAGDPSEVQRRELEKEIERVEGLDKVMRNLRGGKFLDAASMLLNELEDMDVYDMFAEVEGDGAYDLPSFTSIRDRLEAGEFIFVEDVWNQVCAMLAYMLDFFDDGSLSFCFAERLFYEGGRVYNRFFLEHESLITEERALVRIRAICKTAFDRAAKNGVDIVALVSRMAEELQLDSAADAVACAEPRAGGGPALGPGVVDPAVALVQQQQTVVKHKSNYRDDKGYSHLGKQQSAKVLSLALHRPGFDGQVPPPAGGREDAAADAHESTCHACGRQVDDSASSALCCSNVVYRTCRHIFCFQCARTRFGLSDDEFVDARSADVWTCFHCQSACAKRSVCVKEVDPVGGSSPYVIEWRSTDGEGVLRERVEVATARRLQSGEYSDFGPLQQCWRRETAERDCFATTGVARWGAYRCKVVVDGEWHASFCFQILPPPGRVSQSSGPAVSSLDAGDNVSAKVLVGRHAVNASSLQQRCAVRWDIAVRDAADDDKGKDVQSKDLPISLTGVPIKGCSRTEGYDWRASKLFPTVKWVGSTRTPSAPTVSPNHVVAMCASPVDVVPSHNAGHSGVRPGMSVKEHEVARNTAMYNEMRGRQWGIVTGKSGIHGIGIFTMTGYNKGDHVIEYAGQLIRHQVGDLREVRYSAAGLGNYLFTLNSDQIVDATIESNRSRFLNHSCDPNMVSEVVSLRGRDVVIFMASRRIPALAELTFHYHLPVDEGKGETCRCNSVRCTGRMN